MKTLLFNVWSFDCDIHLFHLVKNDNRDDSIIRLHNPIEELSNSLDPSQNVEAYLFEKGEMNQLIDFLNNGDYVTLSVSLSSFNPLYALENLPILSGP